MSGCNLSSQQSAAPANHATLEKLAKAYNAVSEGYPMQPQAMPPKGRREFLEQVFTRAGFDYAASLITLAQATVDKNNPNQRDLAELLLLPARGFVEAELASIFSADELAAVKTLRSHYL